MDATMTRATRGATTPHEAAPPLGRGSRLLLPPRVATMAGLDGERERRGAIENVLALSLWMKENKARNESSLFSFFSSSRKVARAT